MRRKRSHETQHLLELRGNCERAFRFYEHHLGGEITMLMRRAEQPDQPVTWPGWEESIQYGIMKIGETVLMGSDVAPERFQPKRLCCYTLRPPIEQTRLRVDAEGQVWITLRHQWSDGTTHLRVDPVAFLERLAVLIPRPRINLVLYYGLLAPRAPWRVRAATCGPN